MTAVSRTQSKVTLNELLDTLRLLEEEPELLPPPKLFKKDRYAWVDGVRSCPPSDSNSCLVRAGSPMGCPLPALGGWWRVRNAAGSLPEKAVGEFAAARAWASARRSKTVQGLWQEWG